MRHKRQPLSLLIQFTKAAEVSISGKQKIDWTIKLVRPILTAGNSSLLRIDQDDGSGENHWLQGSVVPANNTAVIMGRQHLAVGLKQHCLFRERIGDQVVGRSEEHTSELQS